MKSGWKLWIHCEVLIRSLAGLFQMETRLDFMQLLETDMALNILACLDDASDLIRASSVSRFWRDFGEYYYRLHLESFYCGSFIYMSIPRCQLNRAREFVWMVGTFVQEKWFLILVSNSYRYNRHLEKCPILVVTLLCFHFLPIWLYNCHLTSPSSFASKQNWSKILHYSSPILFTQYKEFGVKHNE